MNPSRIMMTNALLFCVIVGISAWIILQEQQVPGKPRIDELKTVVAERVAAERQVEDTGDINLPNLGRINIFETIIPLPTPTPLPTPPPPQPPRIDDVLEFWSLSAILKSGTGIFRNVKSNTEFNIALGSTVTESYRGKQIVVTLESVDRKKWTATLMINEGGEVQRKTLSMF